MLEWFVRRMVPGEVTDAAEQQHLSPYTLLERRICHPWNGTVTAADWWNGSRNAPCDLTLRGMVMGLSLDTQPEEIYLALLQSIVCGTREIIDLWLRHGVSVNRILATGGITAKSPLLMQEYANLLRRQIAVGQVSEGPALGAAIFAAVAAGVYATPLEAYEHMGVHEFVCYDPDAEHAAQYESIYQRNHALRALAAQWTAHT